MWNIFYFQIQKGTLLVSKWGECGDYFGYVQPTYIDWASRPIIFVNQKIFGINKEEFQSWCESKTSYTINRSWTIGLWDSKVVVQKKKKTPFTQQQDLQNLYKAPCIVGSETRISTNETLLRFINFDKRNTFYTIKYFGVVAI